jgi:hypothetical protein
MTTPQISPLGTACNFAELIESAEQINKQWKNRWGLQYPGFCFRGADKAHYDLNPSLVRPPIPVEC